MANTKISGLTSITGDGLAQDDLLAVVDTSAGQTKKITREEFLKSIDYIQFDTANGLAAPLDGQLTWDGTENTLSLGLNGGSVVLQIGQEMYYRVRNNTGSTISDGTVVMATGSLGASGKITIAPAVADGSIPSKYILGVATENINSGADGLVTAFGKVRGIDTSAFAEGSVLYADPSVVGGLTATRPAPPNNIVSVAFVVSSGSNGTLYIRPEVEDIFVAVPTTSTSTGYPGEVAYDTNYLYICVATDTWKRVSLGSW